MNLFPDQSLLAVMVIFILNYFVVRKFFLKPVNDVLESREHEIRSADELYEQAIARFNEATAEMENQLHSAKREAASVRERFRGEATAYRANVVEKTNSEANAMVSEAEQKLASDVAAARQQITEQAESLARLAADRILGRAV